MPEWFLSNLPSLQQTVSGCRVTGWEMKLKVGAGMEREMSQMSAR